MSENEIKPVDRMIQQLRNDGYDEALELIDRLTAELVLAVGERNRLQLKWDEFRQSKNAEVQHLTAERDAAVADAERLNWLDANGFTAYRQIDPVDGISSHCVVVHETQRPRRGNVHDTIRGAIDAARAEGGV